MQKLTIQECKTTADRDSLLATLHDLCRQAQDAIANNVISLEDSRLMSDYVTQVRLLLTHLGQVECRLGRSERTIMSINALKDLYCDLEGMVKEVRNTLQRGH